MSTAVAGRARWLRRHRGVLVTGLLVLTTLVVLSVLTVGSTTRGAALDPDNPSPGGARAVARVLVDRGVQVSVVRRAAVLDRTPVDAGTTVLVTSSQNLGRSSARRLQAHAEGAGSWVLPDPGPALARALGLPVRADVRAGGSAEAGCDDPLLSDLTLEVPTSTTYRGRGGQITSCFSGPGPAASAWVVRADRSLRGRALPPTYVVGAAALLTNERVDDADNAAVALRLLGQHDRLVWYVPDRRDVAAGDTGSLSAQLPGGLVPALWLMAASLLATMLWRGRRLGPLVVEPLPVVVKAVESTQGRGRLYRRVRDRSHAATILRDAAARRLATRLRLPAGTDPERLAAALAEATGADPRTTFDVLAGRPVTEDRGLIRLAAELAALEREAHQP